MEENQKKGKQGGACNSSGLRTWTEPESVWMESRNAA